MPKIKAEPKDSLTVRIATRTLELLTVISDETHIPKSVLIQLALNDYLAAHYPQFSQQDKPA